MQKASSSWQDATEVRWRERSGRRTSSVLLKTPKGEKPLMRLVYDSTANDTHRVAFRRSVPGKIAAIRDLSESARTPRPCMHQVSSMTQAFRPPSRTNENPVRSTCLVLK